MPASKSIAVVRAFLSYSFGLMTSCLWMAITSADEIDFLRDIQPILVEHCSQCHGGDDKSREAGLRLDTAEGLLRGGDSGTASVVPGKPRESLLIQRVCSPEEDEVMPPPSFKKPLQPGQISLLEKWIEQGAKFQVHWAFVAPTRGDHGQEPSSRIIDRLIEKRWRMQGLVPNSQADSSILCRRLYLDLVGLPPSPAEIQAFQEQGFERTVDQLLASERFGEKWGRHWLDVARYSDTNGYEKDLRREQWIWRDWVIQAFNQDMPYHQFVIEQIAGDLLPNPTQSQIIATGFLRNSMLNEEGAIVPEQFRMVEMFDRLDCIGKGILGLSTQCAQCHNHKFDPISQEEYYGLFAFLNNSYEAQSWVYSDDQLKLKQSVEVAVRGLEDEAKKKFPDYPTQIEAWEDSLRSYLDTPWQPLKFHQLEAVSGLNHPVQLDDHSILMLGHTSSDIFYVAKPPAMRATGVRLELLPHGDLPHAGPGRSRLGTWSIQEVECWTRAPGATDWTKQKLIEPSCDFEQPLEQSADKKKATGPVAHLVDGNDETTWNADRGMGLRNQASVAVLRFENPLDLVDGTEWKWVMRMGEMVGCCRVSLTSSDQPHALPIEHEAVQVMQKSKATRSDQDRHLLFLAWIKQHPELKPTYDSIVHEFKKLPEPMTSVLHLAERTGVHKRATHMLDRGEWDQPREVVDAKVIAALHPMRKDYPLNRLGFAQWLVDADSPLAARVAVNRVWQSIFGVGLVETPEDFGTRAPMPPHRELLDFLATDFMAQGWRHKALIRSIVLSDTYQRSSQLTPQLLEQDPNNIWLARGPRFRADAEVIRDIAMTLSGKIHHRLGGPSVIPPVPKNVLDYNYTYPSYWTPAQGPERYRRTLYGFRKRSMPDPVMSSFDAPNGDFACARRVRSNTPSAALVALNEPVFVEAAQGLALRILKESNGSDHQKIEYAFQLCTGRLPNANEVSEIWKLLQQQRQRLAEGWLNPREIATGNPAQLPELPPGIHPQDAAAWTLVARVLLNLDETLTKS